MNPAVIARAILTRLKADTTLYSGGAWTSALAGGASFNKANPQGVSYPYMVYGIEWNADNAFDGLMGTYTVSFTVFDTDDQGTDRLETVIDRLIGDAMLSSGTITTPTYGLHNHALALPSLGSTNRQGAVSTSLDLSNTNISPSDTVNVNQATVTFTAQTSNKAANL